MKAYLMHRDVNPAYGVYEWWKTEDGKIFELDCVNRFSYTFGRMGHWSII